MPNFFYIGVRLPPLAHRLLLLLSFLLVAALLPHISCVRLAGYVDVFCDSNIIYNYKIQREFDHVLHDLEQSTSPKSWTMDVYGYRRCRPDLPPEQCSRCYAEAVRLIKKTCEPNAASVQNWVDDQCYMRVSLQKFYGQLDIVRCQRIRETYFDIPAYGRETYGKFVLQMLSDSTLKTIKQQNLFSKSIEHVLGLRLSIMIRSVCSPDISPGDCQICLNQCTSNLKSFCQNDNTFCHGYCGSCGIRMETRKY